jgi:hypothetical protein
MPDCIIHFARRAPLKPAGLDNAVFGSTVKLVNPNTHQKSSFCARLKQAAALAWYVRLCPERPGAAS